MANLANIIRLEIQNNKRLQQTVLNVLKPKRSISTSKNQLADGAPLTPQMKEKMRHFQEDNDIPVFLKGGLPDKILFGTTIILIIVGLVETAKLVYTMAVPRKN